MPGTEDGSRSDALAVIKKKLPSIAATPNTTDTYNAVEIPCASLASPVEP